jgi:hypothetical protein
MPDLFVDGETSLLSRAGEFALYDAAALDKVLWAFRVPETRRWEETRTEGGLTLHRVTASGALANVSHNVTPSAAMEVTEHIVLYDGDRVSRDYVGCGAGLYSSTLSYDTAGFISVVEINRV